MKEQSSYSVFGHCHLFHLACVQAANDTVGIEHIYVTLTALWKYFHYCPKCAQSLKEVQKVLHLPELKIVKPLDTHWLAHEQCVKVLKASQSAIVTALDHTFQDLCKAEALGIKKALCQ